MLSQSQNKKKYLNETTTMSIVSLNFYKKKKEEKKRKLQMLVPVTDSDRECSSLSESSNWSSLENNK